MTVDECIDILINHSVCIKHMATCGKNCKNCTVAVSDQKLLEAYNVAMDALHICRITKPYGIEITKAS